MTIDTIVTDLDDTLLDGSGQLSAYTIEVMAEVKRRGIRLIPCSGRTHASHVSLSGEAGYGPALHRGQRVGDRGGGSPPDRAADAGCGAGAGDLRLPCGKRLYVQVYTDEAFYYSAECDIARRYKQSSGMKGVAVGDVCAFLSFATPKVLSVGEPEVCFA